MQHLTQALRVSLVLTLLTCVGILVGAVWANYQAVPAVEAVDRSPTVFLKLDGIPGGSLHPAHLNEFDVASAQWIRKGTKTGAATVLDITLASNASSPLLMQHVAIGQHLKSAELSLIQPDNSTVIWKMKDVVITSYEISGIAEQPASVDRFLFTTTQAVEIKKLPAPPLPDPEPEPTPTSTPPVTPDPLKPVLTNVSVETIVATSVLTGQIIPIEAQATYSDQTKKYITSQCVWGVSDPEIASVSGGSLSILSKAGTVDVTCAYTEQGVSKTGSITFIVQLDPTIFEGGGGGGNGGEGGGAVDRKSVV